MVGRLNEPEEEPNKAEEKNPANEEGPGVKGGARLCGVCALTLTTLGHKAESSAFVPEESLSYT